MRFSVTIAGIAVGAFAVLPVIGCSAHGSATTSPSATATPSVPAPAAATGSSVPPSPTGAATSSAPATRKPASILSPQATTTAPKLVTPPHTVLPTHVMPTTAAPAAGCHPLTSSGNCYEPGELCPASDHGVYGVAGDGKAIVCEDNNGWRWEPAGPKP